MRSTSTRRLYAALAFLTAVLPANAALVAHYRMDENTGTAVNDSSGNGLHGTITGPGVTWVPGQLNSGLAFDASTDRVFIPYNAAMDFTTSFSLSFWIKAPANQQGVGGEGIATIIDKSHGGANGFTGWAVQARAAENGAISFALGTGSGFPEPRIPGVLDDTWHHVAILVNTVPTLNIKGLRDGVLITDYNDVSTTIANNTGTLSFGAWWGGGGPIARQFNGRIDDLRLYSGLLSNECVLAEIASPTGFVDCNNNSLPDICEANSHTDGVGPLEHRVFVSSTTHQGNIGGLEGADLLCQTLAQNAGLRRTYRAIMSDSVVAARNRLSILGGRIFAIESDGEKILVKSNGDLWDTQNLNHAINLDEFGQTQTGSVWTGTNKFGLPSATNCNYWNEGTPTFLGGLGIVGATNSSWVLLSSQSCLGNQHVYCISQEFDERDCNNNGVLDSCESPCNISVSAPTGVRFVLACKSPGGNGQTWATAYGRLQDALFDAENSAGTITQLWVAGGTYEPDSGGLQVLNDRFASISLRNDLAIYGGFSCGDNELSDRNPNLNVSILSGDLSGDDGANFVSNGENSLHVVSAPVGINATAVLDGFVIRGGNANGANPNHFGGGLFVNGGIPTIRNCTFVGNSAAAPGVGGGGGAIAIRLNGAPTILNCRFSDNRAVGDAPGGAVYVNAAPNPILTGCYFSGNIAHQGGGIYAYNTALTVSDCTFESNDGSGELSAGGAVFASNGETRTYTNCTFLTNSAAIGGAMAGDLGATTVVDRCRFLGNMSAGPGGALHLNAGGAFVFNTLFSGNSSGASGGAAHCTDTTPFFFNCTFSRNAATSGGGAIQHVGGAFSLVLQCILWDNAPTQIEPSTAGENTTVSFSDIQGGWLAGGPGTISVDPLLADADGSDNIIGTLDDDAHLTIASPCIDNGQPGYTPGSNFNQDFDGQPRVQCGRVDMGADEFAGGVSHSGDVNITGATDLADVPIFAQILVSGGANCAADVNGDAVVDGRDIRAFVNLIVGP